MSIFNNTDVGSFLRHSHGHSDDHEDEDGHSHSDGIKHITLTKVICMILLGVSSFVSGNLPLLLSRLDDSKNFKSDNDRLRAKLRKRKIISVLLAFTGGVLFCTVFLHLMPEVGEVFEDYKDLPEFMPQALLCIGFFIMYFVEEVAHKLMHVGNKSKTNLPVDRTKSQDSQLSLSYNNFHENHSVNGDTSSIFIKNVINITEEASRNLSVEERQKIIQCIKKATTAEDSHGPRLRDINSGNPIRDSPESGCKNNDIHELELVTSSRASIRSFLLALALSVHALFEGMAIGLERQSKAVWLMLLGVGCHKVLLSVCMGIEMVAGNIKKLTHVAYVTVFAIVSPLGMAAGVFVSTEHGALSAIFQGLAAGTLLYVLFYEVLKRNNGSGTEDNSVDSGFTPFFAIILGFALMALLQVYADDD